MRRTYLISAGVAAGLALGLAACSQADGNSAAGNAQASTAGAEAAVKAAESEILAAWKARDAAGVASHYADDAVVAVPGETPANGRDAILKSVTADLADPAFTLDFTNQKTAVAASGELAYTRGTFKVTFTNPQTKKPQSGAGTYLTVFRKGDDGSWKAAEDFATAGPEAG